MSSPFPAVSRLLHWVMAVMILAMLFMPALGCFAFSPSQHGLDPNLGYPVRSGV